MSFQLGEHAVKFTSAPGQGGLSTCCPRKVHLRSSWCSWELHLVLLKRGMTIPVGEKF